MCVIEVSYQLFLQHISNITRVSSFSSTSYRFDMLHNPHLGLSRTLGKLYKLAKLMADCVVPQEYGTTVEEKKSIGCKMCSTLLDKIK
jgi:inositol hexakisphosphate/diphosphoinositol-pentakisphosphate kinase